MVIHNRSNIAPKQVNPTPSRYGAGEPPSGTCWHLTLSSRSPSHPPFRYGLLSPADSTGVRSTSAAVATHHLEFLVIGITVPSSTRGRRGKIEGDTPGEFSMRSCLTQANTYILGGLPFLVKMRLFATGCKRMHFWRTYIVVADLRHSARLHYRGCPFTL